MEQYKNKYIQFIKSPKRITMLVLCVAIGFLLYLLLSNQTFHNAQIKILLSPTPQQKNPYPKTNPAFITSVLSFTKQNNSSLAMVINTGQNAVSGVQVAITYDPEVLKNVFVTPGAFFTNPTILENSVDIKKGIISSTMTIHPGESQKKGRGTVLTIYYTQTSGASTTLSFLPPQEIP